jgi:hypothetical protein
VLPGTSAEHGGDKSAAAAPAGLAERRDAAVPAELAEHRGQVLLTVLAETYSHSGTVRNSPDDVDVASMSFERRGSGIHAL